MTKGAPTGWMEEPKEAPDPSGSLPALSGNINFPAVRRVFPGLIANELVSVQPMSAPSGLLFYLDYTFEHKGCPLKIGGSVKLK